MIVFLLAMRVFLLIVVVVALRCGFVPFFEFAFPLSFVAVFFAFVVFALERDAAFVAAESFFKYSSRVVCETFIYSLPLASL